ncbi:chemoreceptor glutamine deamidase CheD [Hydrocarboniphaga sp.]|uniref:chemoreceptor glutamine deamidase CheD n=1 Tax=Hydrocarboniphaga sp. TaxID=2033016 RepID=UPI003D0F7E01
MSASAPAGDWISSGANTDTGYYDPRFSAQAIKLLPGEFRVTSEDLMLVTVLGSCVSACLRDPVAGVGGMNHFMLPDSMTGGPSGESARYGNYAMEVLINELFKRGARRERLEAKLVGGGAVLPGMTLNPVGDRNGQFALAYLQAERIQLTARDLFDSCPRRVHYFPATGRMLVKRLPPVASREVAISEERYRKRVRRQPAAGSVELF